MTTTNIPQAVRLTADYNAKDIRRALGNFRRTLTRFNKRPESQRIMSDHFVVDTAENMVSLVARHAAHYAFEHGLISREAK